MISVDVAAILRRLNRHCTRSLEGAAGLCVTRRHYEVTIEHALLKMLEEPGCDIHDILRNYGVDASRLQKRLVHVLDDLRSGNAGRPVLSPGLMEWLQEGWLLSTLEYGLFSLRSGPLLLAVVNRPDRFAAGDWIEVLEPVQKDDLKKKLLSICTGSVEDEAPPVGPGSAGTGAAAGTDGHGGGTGGALAQFCTNITARAREGAIDPVFGRDREIRQMIDILARRRKNNPIVVGEAGVGKTAVVEGLALLIVEGSVPSVLQNVDILVLDLGLLQAGASVKGEFENRLKAVINETKASPKPIILFIDEAHTLIGAGGPAGGGDAANLLKPALARGELRTIAATTWSEYKKYFEKDPALARRFQAVKLDEPSEEDTVTMLRGLRTKYEEAHQVRILDDAVVAAARLSSRYISGRQLPDKAVDLLDTASARVKIGLSSKPADLEDMEQRIRTLLREQEARRSDSADGVEGDHAAEAELEERLTKARAESVTLRERWQKELEAARCVVELRAASAAARKTSAAEKTAAGAVAEKTQAVAIPAGRLETVPKDTPMTTHEGAIAESEALVKTGPEKAGSEGAGPESAAGVSILAPPVEGGNGGAAAPEVTDPVLTLGEALSRLRAIQGRDALIHIDVNPEVVAQVVADWTGIPVGKMVRDEAATILGFDDQLKKRIKGQDHAIEAVARGIRAAKAGLGNPRAPMGVFLFVGPSGTGKTETALGVADLLFGGERFMVTINMSEFQEKHTVSRLIGSPPGYVGYGEGGVLTEAVRQRPYSVVLLDEVEKADPEVMNLFYQVFDKGSLSDGEGREIDFKNTAIIMTSNLASDTLMQMGSGPVRPDPDELVSAIRPALNKHFKPALVARMTIVPFYPISTEAMKEIVQLKLDSIGRRLQSSHKIAFRTDPAVVEQIAQRCTEVETGARNIDHILGGTLLPIISTELLTRMSMQGLPTSVELSLDEAGEFRLQFAP